jgi:drug/metabolite transporter (DMT)-like permease
MKLSICQRTRHQLERGKGERLIRHIITVVLYGICCLICLFGYFVYLRGIRAISPDATFGIRQVIYVVIFVVPLYGYLFTEISPSLLLKKYLSSLARKKLHSRHLQ